MKKTKIIVPALGMLLLSTAASVTGTVAWFSSNAQVSASSMTVKATVGANLYIGKGQKAIADLTDTTVSDLAITNTTLNPSTMSNSSGTVTCKFPATWTTKPTVSTAGEAATYNNAGTLTVSAGTNNADPAATLTDYCAYAFVTIGRKQTATGGSYDLTPTCSVTFGADSNLNKALRCGVIMNGGWYESDDMNTASGTVTFTWEDNGPIASLTDNTAYNACLVMWYEGTDSDCITNNAITLGNAVATWYFDSADHVNA